MLKVLILLLFPNLIHSYIHIADQQFKNDNINISLKKKVPYLQQNLKNATKTQLPEKNIFSLIFQPSESTYSTFASITGQSLKNTRFYASWYIFDDVQQMPRSTTEAMTLINNQRPVCFNAVVYANNKWSAQAELPYSTYNDKHHVFVYISIVNQNGILVPISSQSYYKDTITGLAYKEQTLSLNLELIRFWMDRGYFKKN